MVSQPHTGVAEVMPRQSNYQKYRLPDGLEGLAHAPLYQVVAVWGWRLGRAFCRDELAEAFVISPHRAGDQMSYIRRARPDCIQSRTHHERQPNGSRRRYLTILAEPRIDGRPARVPPVHLVEREVQQADIEKVKADLQALRSWFLRRSSGQ